MKNTIQFIDTYVDLDGEAASLLEQINAARANLPDQTITLGPDQITIKSHEIFQNSHQINFSIPPTAANIIKIRDLYTLILNITKPIL
jgi:hypothetical protein